MNNTYSLRRVAALYEAERASQEAYAHLGLRTPEEQYAFDEQVRFLTRRKNMGLLPAIRWTESEWANNPEKMNLAFYEAAVLVNSENARPIREDQAGEGAVDAYD